VDVRRATFGAVVLVSLVVLFAPGPTVPRESLVSDKVVHLTLFAVLALTGRRAHVALLPLTVGLVAYAGVSEVLQAVLPIARDGDVRDALADVTGVVVGLVVFVLAGRGRQSNV
jgi:VanZ family protein